MPFGARQQIDNREFAEERSDEPPADFQDVRDDPVAAEQVGKIISDAMINGPWTGC